MPWQQLQRQVFTSTLPPVTLATGVGTSEGSDLAKVTANSCSHGPNGTVRTSEQGGDAGSQEQRSLQRGYLLTNATKPSHKDTLGPAQSS